jgi:hypothetical protein
VGVGWGKVVRGRPYEPVNVVMAVLFRPSDGMPNGVIDEVTTGRDGMPRVPPRVICRVTFAVVVGAAVPGDIPILAGLVTFAEMDQGLKRAPPVGTMKVSALVHEFGTKYDVMVTVVRNSVSPMVLYLVNITGIYSVVPHSVVLVFELPAGGQ